MPLDAPKTGHVVYDPRGIVVDPDRGAPGHATVRTPDEMDVQRVGAGGINGSEHIYITVARAI